MKEKNYIQKKLSGAMRYKVIAVMAGVLCSIPVAAESVEPELEGGHKYVPMIRTDRVWEYCHNQSFPQSWKPYCSTWKMKFDGTESRYGKTYHVFKAFDGVRVYSDIDTDTFVVEKNSFPPYRYLLREEEGKVYVLNENYGKEIDKDILFPDLEPDNYSQEFLLYDFTLKEGSDMPFVYQNPVGDFGYLTEGYTDGYGYHAKVRLASLNTVDIDGEECLVQTLTNIQDDEFPALGVEGYRLIEGIGNETDGELFRHSAGVKGTDGDLRIQINNIYDSQGNVIYQGKNTDISYFEKVSVDAVQDKTVSISYADGILTVEGCRQAYCLEIYSAQGIHVRSFSDISEEHVDVNNLARGVYVAILKSGTHHRALRFFIDM